MQHVTLHGTHRASTMPLLADTPVTGRSAAWAFIHIWRVADGMLVEHWACRDDLGLLEQLRPVVERGPAHRRRRDPAQGARTRGRAARHDARPRCHGRVPGAAQRAPRLHRARLAASPLRPSGPGPSPRSPTRRRRPATSSATARKPRSSIASPSASPSPRSSAVRPPRRRCALMASGRSSWRALPGSTTSSTTSARRTSAGRGSTPWSPGRWVSPATRRAWSRTTWSTGSSATSRTGPRGDLPRRQRAPRRGRTIEELELRTGRLVVEPANQALLWGVLTVTGTEWHLPGHGRLLRSPSA